ncbi:DNA repair protein RecN (Recombination protein N) [Arcanobacterium pluranimalium]|uniref:DNA repair protein RecN n=1 Tax=Arcanobacterium pluranimalium TaxID=108028 RepID=UPI0019585DE5|nr:DNA repair protein RecN [Arcanobacterium pluranimalium]MBM7825326.1 DNA repair protein RecN (Recombination protein N) [Arcanobacterium pluranimalium]
MIEELNIHDLGVIQEAHLFLGSGMTAITGETGAGKTMALTSLDLLMGGKADANKVRLGAERAVVEGVFRVAENSPAIAIVEEAGGRVENDDAGVAIIVSRHVLSKGRSRAFLGGASVPVSVLQDVAQHLVTVHGQSDQLHLVSPTQHRIALDAYAGITNSEIEKAYVAQWDRYNQLLKEVAHAKERAESAGTERLALEALIQRIDATEPEIGEDEALKNESLRLENVESLRRAIAQSLWALSGDDSQQGALDLIDSSAHLLEKSDDSELKNLAQELLHASQIASEVVNQLGMIAESVDADPQRLNEIHERRAQLRAIQRELSMDIPTLLARRDEARAQLVALEDPQAHIEQLERQCEEASAELMDLGAKISARRAEAAKNLSAMVTSELHNLAMKDAIFSVDIVHLDKASKEGLETIEFLLTPHKGAKPGKLAATASGGELSRVMLALEVTLSQGVSDADHTFIFDEVDAGIGGKTALSIGERLAKLSQKSQVLVVTHLAQVAAYAAAHVVVDKQTEQSSTITQVRVMDAEERERELARMLSGHEDSEAARTHAAELLRASTMAT